MNRPWKVILAFLGVFAAGAVFGGFLTLRLGRHFADQARLRGPAPMEQFTPQIFRRLSDRLELTDAQQQKIRPIIRQADGAMRRLRQSGAREAFAVAERMHEQVAAILTPEQQAKLEKYKRELRERWVRDRQLRWGDRPPGGRLPLPPPPLEDRPDNTLDDPAGEGGK